MHLFNCLSMQESAVKRKYKLLANYIKSDNILRYNVKILQHINRLNMLDKLWIFQYAVYIS